MPLLPPPAHPAVLALDLAATAAGCRTVAALRRELLPELCRVLGAHLAIYHQISFGPVFQEFGVVWPDEESVVTTLASYPSVAAHSPLIQRFTASPGVGVSSIGELVSARQWRANPVYRESHRALGVEDQLAVVLDVQGSGAHAITLSRSTGAFSAREHQLAALLVPHLRAAVLRCLDDPTPYRVAETVPVPRWTSRTGPALAGPGRPLLTSREAEVLALVAAGLSGREVARRLQLSPRTVDKHLEHVHAKLGARSRVEAVALARSGGRLPGCGGGAGRAPDDPGTAVAGTSTRP
ncbi:helix-turn-helix transcriptional regulator [Auraticoccus monumenti]|uniref:Regulatory protein, luxR family n=1 Tax=Auraticoccus monumenti TaxID=675864 RepID=A0A1G7C0R5_9ACTN|nr:LuxR C-terminal-related transcriptional regulator [Auraticoccus monumenti]SDE32911.1 regulatory protein, luxR family [Auraticoccus monumenti]